MLLFWKKKKRIFFFHLGNIQQNHLYSNKKKKKKNVRNSAKFAKQSDGPEKTILGILTICKHRSSWDHRWRTWLHCGPVGMPRVVGNTWILPSGNSKLGPANYSARQLFIRRLGRPFVFQHWGNGYCSIENYPRSY